MHPYDMANEPYFSWASPVFTMQSLLTGSKSPGHKICIGLKA
ncbi:uncharacterized protein METZ01_LOCUS393966, partial [marine metagenome]